eukprot:TRINITY_DN4360_c0_g1_i2.p1 TRINITY_DN4360_c0_g1~~TRINITY_DN4360_c0_g1_i2.p1  ORF type:complete len:628 (+),score=144.23 TRINITY_DN4360_c0_g1_i2:135-1886(+)
MESDGESEEYFVEDAFPSPVTRREDRRSTALPSNWDTNWSLPRSSVGSGEAAVDLDMIAGVDVDEDALVRVDEDVSSSRMAIPEERGGRTMEQRLVHLSERERNATQSYARDATFSIEACIKAAPTRLEAILFRVVESVFESRKSENLSAKVARCLEDVAAEHIPCEMDQTILDYGDAFSKFQGRKGQPFDFDAFRHSYSQNVKDQDRNICKSLLIFFRTGMRKEAREWLKKKEQHWRVASIWGSGELWKASCKHLARDQNLFPEERAVYGLLCGDFHPLFETCKTWEDAMWALCSCFSLPETQIHTWQGMMGTLDSFLKDAEIRISEEEAFFFECTKRFLCGLGDEEAENSFWQWLETQASKEESETESCREESSWSIQKRRVACHLSILFMPRDDDARDSVIIGPTQRAVLHLVMSYINALHETEIHYDTQIIAHYFNALSIHYPQVVQDGYARYLLELPEEMKRKAFESAKRCGLDAQAIFERVLGLVDDSFLENDAKESRDFEEFQAAEEILRNLWILSHHSPRSCHRPNQEPAQRLLVHPIHIVLQIRTLCASSLLEAPGDIVHIHPGQPVDSVSTMH